MSHLTESIVLEKLKKKNPEKMSDVSLLDAGTLIVNFFYQYAASDPFGWDWPTMNATFPELCLKFREYKMHYKSKMGVLQFKHLIPITTFETLTNKGIPTGNVYRKYRDTNVKEHQFVYNSRKGWYGDGDQFRVWPESRVRMFTHIELALLTN